MHVVSLIKFCLYFALTLFSSCVESKANFMTSLVRTGCDMTCLVKKALAKFEYDSQIEHRNKYHANMKYL